MSENAFDAVVIGSGLGGLTAAALLAKAGRKVCVIERNHSVGGAASVFRKGALTIEPALHQTADPHYPGDPKHAILKELGLIDEIEWIPISPFYSVKGGPIGDVFDLPVGFDAAHHALSQRFPKSARGLRQTARRNGADRSTASSELAKAGEERSVAQAGSGRRNEAAAARSRLARLDRRHAGSDLGGDEAAKCAVGATIGYYADDARHLAWPFFAMFAGRLLQGRRRVHQRRLARPVDEARQGRDQGGRIGIARPRRERDRPRHSRAVPPTSGMSTRRPGRTSSGS